MVGSSLEFVMTKNEVFDIFKAINDIFNQLTKKTLVDKISIGSLKLEFKPEDNIIKS